MDEPLLLRKIHDSWVLKVYKKLAPDHHIRQELRDQVEVFYLMLEQSLETGELAWLDSILASWVATQTQAELESDSNTLVDLINILSQSSYEASQECLSAPEALQLLGKLMPFFAYVLNKSVKLNIDAKIRFVTNQLNQAQEQLEKLDQSKSDFITIAAHELKTPLTLIEGYTAMLVESIKQKDISPDDLILINGIQRGTERLQVIINDMIDVAMIDNHLMSLVFQPVWLNQLFYTLQLEFTEIVKERKLTLTVNPFDGSSQMTFGDPERLLQVFHNLLNNAIKYTPDGGKIVVDGRILPGYIEITVADTGIGINPENQTKIFQKFGGQGNIALHSSGKTKFKGGGPGLGLPIARGIIEAHEGTIWVESPGFNEILCPGSTFHVILPLRTTPPDDKMAKLFARLNSNNSLREENN